MTTYLMAVCRFRGAGAADSRSLRYDSYVSPCRISFVDLLVFPFDVLGGMCGENSCKVFLMLFMVLWIPISATLCMRVVACLLVPQALACGVLSSLLLFAW
jgi:hypothetical protein